MEESRSIEPCQLETDPERSAIERTGVVVGNESGGEVPATDDYSGQLQCAHAYDRHSRREVPVTPSRSPCLIGQSA